MNPIRKMLFMLITREGFGHEEEKYFYLWRRILVYSLGERVWNDKHFILIWNKSHVNKHVASQLNTPAVEFPAENMSYW